jgi:hypothetical protein
MNFEQNIQQWIQLDNQIQMYNEKIKELRNKKNLIENNITSYAANNNILNSSIKIVNTKVIPPLTFKYLEKSLGEIIKNKDQVNRIILHIRNNRDIRVIPEIKRLSNN